MPESLTRMLGKAREMDMPETHLVGEVDFTRAAQVVQERGLDLGGMMRDLRVAIVAGDLRDTSGALSLALWVLSTSIAPHCQQDAQDLLSALSKANCPQRDEARYNLAQLLITQHLKRHQENPGYGDQLLAMGIDMLRSILDSSTQSPHPGLAPAAWIEKAATALLAECYATGYGCNELVDLDAAIALYRMVALQGDSNAAYCAGVLLEQCQRVNEAAQMYEMAVQKGHALALTNLGILHYADRFDGSNPERGLSLLRQASLDGDAQARAAIDRITQARLKHFDSSDNKPHH